MARIISASRRTDIPRFYAAWFAERRKAGFAEFRNAFGFRGQASLMDGDVLGYLFWTKHAAPFVARLEELREQGVPFVFQYTLNGYGAPLEPNIPAPERVIENVREICAMLPSARCLQWRYDPIVLTERQDEDFHLKNFSELALALEGCTEVVNISFVEPYLKAIRRIEDSTVRYRRLDPGRHKTVSKRYPRLRQIGDEIRGFLDELAAIARGRGMELRACANPEWGLPAAQCCSAEMFAPYGEALEARLRRLKLAPSREACRCLESLDIGMDNTCVGGCRYCYVVSSHESAVKNHACHDPNGARLR